MEQELIKQLQEALVALERATNKGRAAAKDALYLPNLKFKKFDTYYRVSKLFEAVHNIKLMYDSSDLFKE